jgi:hypothetical protein
MINQVMIKNAIMKTELVGQVIDIIPSFEIYYHS